MKTVPMPLAALILAFMSGGCTSEVDPVIPNPVLRLSAQMNYTENGRNWVRYEYEVLNRAAYPAELFAPAPDLPPCGKNTSSSRAWVDLYDQAGKRLYGFCALAKPEALGKVWFALEEGATPPVSVYLEIEDRKTKRRYKSNLAQTAPEGAARSLP